MVDLPRQAVTIDRSSTSCAKSFTGCAIRKERFRTYRRYTGYDQDLTDGLVASNIGEGIEDVAVDGEASDISIRDGRSHTDDGMDGGDERENHLFQVRVQELRLFLVPAELTYHEIMGRQR